MAKKKYTLVGVDGNAYAVMAYVRNAMQKEGKSNEEINNYLKDAQSDDYHHLIAVSVEMCAKLNRKDEEPSQDSTEQEERIVNVDWDTDEESPEECGLPEEVSIPWWVPDERVADYCSDLYGFCVNSWYEV